MTRRPRQTILPPPRMGSGLETKGLIAAALIIAAMLALIWFWQMVFNAVGWVLALSLGHVLLGAGCGVAGYWIGRRR